MYLNIKENTKRVHGNYYYNGIVSPIYFEESALDKNSKLTLKEFANRYPDLYKGENSTGQFTRTFNKKLGLKVLGVMEKEF